MKGYFKLLACIDRKAYRTIKNFLLKNSYYLQYVQLYAKAKKHNELAWGSTRYEQSIVDRLNYIARIRHRTPFIEYIHTLFTTPIESVDYYDVETLSKISEMVDHLDKELKK